MKKCFKVLSILLMFCIFQSNIVLSQSSLPQVSLSEDKVFQGDFIIISLANLKEGIKVKVENNLGSKAPYWIDYNYQRIGIIPISYWTQPGTYELSIEFLKDKEVIYTKVNPIEVAKKEFDTQYLKVNKKKEKKRSNSLWSEDRKYILEAKSNSAKRIFWQQGFILPVEGSITTDFGMTRYINNKIAGRHSGIDIAAASSTSVKVTNSGKVVLAMPLNVTGNTIIVDHGMNLFSAYSHLKSINVKVGDKVERGEIIGEVGSTGFSTGPHLHFTFSVGSTFINPWLIIDKNPISTIIDTKTKAE